MPRKVYNAVVLLRNTFAKEYISIILSKQGIKLLASPTSCNQTLMLIEQMKPDLFIGEDDFDTTEIVLPKLPKLNLSVKVILICNDSKAEDILAYFEYGVLGLLRVDSPHFELSEAIKLVLNNQLFLSSVYQKTINKEQIKTNLHYKQLTHREKEIMRLIADGFTNVQIGLRLSLSQFTINNHRANIRKKLNISGGKFALLQTAISENSY